MQRPGAPGKNNDFRQKMEVENLRSEVQQLTDMLKRERLIYCNEMSEIRCLKQQLRDTLEQLSEQKALQDKYINKTKETREELERLKKYSSEETLSTFRIAQKARNKTKQKKKQDLKVDYEELKVAYLVHPAKWKKELKDMEIKKYNLLEELDRSKGLYHSLKAQYEADMIAGKRQVETPQHEAEERRQDQADRVSQDQQIESLRAELDTLCRKTTEVINDLRKAAFTKETAYVEDLKSRVSVLRVIQKQYEELQLTLKSSQNKFAAELQAEKNTIKNLQEQLEKLTMSSAESQQRQPVTANESLQDKLGNNQYTTWKLTTEEAAIQHQMDEEINTLQEEILLTGSDPSSGLKENENDSPKLEKRCDELPCIEEMTTSTSSGSEEAAQAMELKPEVEGTTTSEDVPPEMTPEEISL